MTATVAHRVARVLMATVAQRAPAVVTASRTSAVTVIVAHHVARVLMATVALPAAAIDLPRVARVPAPANASRGKTAAAARPVQPAANVRAAVARGPRATRRAKTKTALAPHDPRFVHLLAQAVTGRTELVSRADAGRVLDRDQIAWATIIFVMEAVHQRRLKSRFGRDLRAKKVICLDIPNNDTLMQPELIELLIATAGRLLKR